MRVSRQQFHALALNALFHSLAHTHTHSQFFRQFNQFNFSIQAPISFQSLPIVIPTPKYIRLKQNSYFSYFAESINHFGIRPARFLAGSCALFL